MRTKRPPPSKERPMRRSSDGDRTGRLLVENVNHPGKAYSLDAAHYQAMRRALLKVLPAKTPGLTLAEVSAAVLADLPDELFPGGATAGWWLKAVQLDLEAKGTISRERTTPLRLHRA